MFHSTKSVIFYLVASASLLVLLALHFELAQHPAVSAKLCKQSRSSQIWKHSKGTFEKDAKGVWREFNDKHAPNAETFVEVQREGPTTIVLHDAKRDVKILLKDGVCGLQNKGEHNFQQLYQGEWLVVMDCT